MIHPVQIRSCLNLLVIAAAAVTFLPGCSANPATGRSYFMLLSREEEAQIGAEAAPQFTSEFGGPVTDERLRRYVDNIGRRLAAQTEADYPQLDWEFTLLDSKVVNAFALPGGKVFISRGLAERLDNEAQMAGVLGHEVGHVTAQHANRRISKQMGFNLGMAIAAVAVGASDSDSDLRKYGQYAVPALAIGGNVILLRYGREEELEADWLGLRYMSRVGYKPSGQLGVMQVLAELSEGDRPPEFLSTHPHPETRIRQIEELLASEYRDEEASAAYQLYRERYHSEFLTPLSKLPPPRHGGAEKTADAAGGPASWCALCAAKVPP